MTEENSTHVLIVDDNAVNCNLLAKRLKKRGFIPTIALNGVEAIDAIDRLEFDLVLLDVAMPGMSGLDVLRVIRLHYPMTELPVLMVTAHKDSEVVIEALSLGANDYLTKPLDLPILLARMDTQLRLSAPPHSLPTGEYRRLRGKKRRLAHASTHCARCTACQESESERCEECGAARPPEGWPPIEGSNYEHLGKTVAGRYFLDRFVGRGAAGSVYRARDIDLNRKFAVKVIDLGHNPAASVTDRLEAEVEAMASLTNPHVVGIFEVVVLSSNIFALVMDFVAGKTLGVILEQVGKLDPKLALEIVRQVAQGLHEAHQHGLIHRDVKPENIMLEKLPAGGYHARILDFGIVMELGHQSIDTGIIGTPLYMSPEHYSDEIPLDHRADIYSLGAVLYHALVGQPPFMAGNVVGILNKHLNAPVPLLTPVMGDTPFARQLDGLLARMMAKAAADRFDSLFEFIQQLDAVLPSAPGSQPSDLVSVGPSGAKPVEDDRPMLVNADTPGVRKLSGTIQWPKTSQPAVCLSSTMQLISARPLASGCSVVHVDFANEKARRKDVAFAGDKVLASISYDGRFAMLGAVKTGSAQVIDVKSGRALFGFRFPSQSLTALAIGSDGCMAAAGDRDGRVFVVERGEEPVELMAKGAPVTCLAMSVRQAELAVGRVDKTLVVTPMGQQGLRTTLPELPFVPTMAVFNGVGDLGAVLSADKHISLFLPLGGAIVNQLEFAFDSVLTIAFDEQDRLVCLEHRDDKLRLWDIQSLFEGGAGRTTIIRSESE
jgi:serine/threonine protein kinase/DNA-binding NarL/FixJ family response regulator